MRRPLPARRRPAPRRREPRRSDGPPVLRLRTPADLVVAVPHLLGFVPADSLVLVACGGRRLAMTARVDLALTPGETDLDHLADAVRRAGGDRVHLLAYPPAGPEGPTLPAAGLVGLVAHGLSARGIALGDLLCVTGEARAQRYRSYACAEPDCCPPEGRIVGPQDCAEVRAAFVLAGRAVRPDRESLVASLAPLGPLDPRVRQLSVAVEDEERRRAEEVVAGGRSGWARRSAVRLDRALREACVATPVRPLDPQDAALLVVAAQLDLPLRDTLLGAALRRRDLDALGDVLAPVVRAGGELVGGGIAAMAAAVAYLAGDGALTWVAIDRALAVQADQSLALLLTRALSSGMPPDVFAEAVRVLAPPERWDGQPVSMAQIERRLAAGDRRRRA